MARDVAELKEAVRRLRSIVKHGTIEAAAQSVGRTKGAFADWLYPPRNPARTGLSAASGGVDTA